MSFFFTSSKYGDVTPPEFGQNRLDLSGLDVSGTELRRATWPQKQDLPLRMGGPGQDPSSAWAVASLVALFLLVVAFARMVFLFLKIPLGKNCFKLELQKQSAYYTFITSCSLKPLITN